MGKKSSELSQSMRREISDPLLMHTARQLTVPRPVTKEDFRTAFFQMRTIFLTIFFIASMIINHVTTIYVYSHMMHIRALPDAIADQWKSFALLRSIPIIANVRISTVITIVFVVVDVYTTINCFNVANVRKFVLILGLSLLMRSIFNLMTQLPPPCAHYPNCICMDRDFADIEKEKYSKLQILMIYIFTLGFGTEKVPACGDFMMSGHVALQCCLGFYFLDIYKYVSLSKPKQLGVRAIVMFMIAFSALYSVLIRVEYTISSLLAVFFVGFCWAAYWCCQNMIWAGYEHPFLTTILGQLFMFIEQDDTLY